MDKMENISCFPFFFFFFNKNYEWYRRDPMSTYSIDRELWMVQERSYGQTNGNFGTKLFAPVMAQVVQGWSGVCCWVSVRSQGQILPNKTKAMFTNLLIYCIPSRLCHPLDKILSVIFSPSKLLDWPQFWICYNYYYLGILQVMGYSDTDVAEYLYTSKPQIDSLVNFLCKDLTKACSTKPPPVPKVIAFWTNTLGDLFMPFWGAFSVK